MKTLVPYLFFAGNCREAMNFYKDCLSGEITIMQTCGEAPIAFPPEAGEMIFNSEMQSEGVTIKASDNSELKSEMVGEKNFCLFVNFTEKSEFKDACTKLSENGKIVMQHDEQFVMLKDKFGFSWMLNSMGE